MSDTPEVDDKVDQPVGKRTGMLFVLGSSIATLVVAAVVVFVVTGPVDLGSSDRNLAADGTDLQNFSTAAGPSE